MIRTGGEGRPQTDKILQDINGDGNFELVDDETLIFRDCASYEVVFPVIYAWTGAGIWQCERPLPGFYRHKLETLNSRLATIDAKKQAIAARGLEGLRPAMTSRDPRKPACLPAMLVLAKDHHRRRNRLRRRQAARLTRFDQLAATPLGGQNCVPASLNSQTEKVITRTTGRSRRPRSNAFWGRRAMPGSATRSSYRHGDDWRDRMLAADIFGDIPTGEARDYLLKLSHDDAGLL